MKTLGGLANSIKPRMANTMAVTISPSIIKPSRPLTATITGEEPMLCANNPTLAATRNPIDAQGLTEEPTMDASNIGTGMSRGTGNFARDNQNFFAQTAEEQTTMNQMARDTGGEAFVNTNGLK